MWLTHKNKKCTFIWTWNTSYMDTNRTHIQRCHNLGLGLATKAKACKGVGQEWSLGV
jgi:hypothetical protein